jgi:ADP-ribosyl-[dinitrogen reductase] hydrolase
VTRDQQLGGLLGLLVGDALGVPYEFHDPRNLPPRDQLDFEPPPGFRRSHHGTPTGTWSDDGAHALALLDVLLTCGGWDDEAFATRLRAWWDRGDFAVDARPFDIGNQTSDVLGRLERGVPAARAGGSAERDNGNGSLMRVLPVALWSPAEGAELLSLAAASSVPTHAHPRSQLCCAVLVAWARGLAAGVEAPFDHALAAVEVWCPEEWRAEWAVVLGFGPPRGSGYVVDTLWSARAALEDATDYASAVRAAVAFGLDTDTTACVAGGLAGIRFGPDAIPAAWRRNLRGRELVAPLVARWLGPAGAARLAGLLDS